jgi:threonine/homoserine/homoserine lactone efflux protein
VDADAAGDPFARDRERALGRDLRVERADQAVLQNHAAESNGLLPPCFNGLVHSFAVFAGIAVLVVLTPGPATAMVVRSALRGGRRAALASTFGNGVGVFFWGAASALGVSALIAASEAAFLGLKITGGVVLVALGAQSLLRTRRAAPAEERRRPGGCPFRVGLITSLANPKLAVFFVALFPQFLSTAHAPLVLGLAMAGLIVGLDLMWFSAVALAVTRARDAVAARWGGRLERLAGSVMIGLGLRVALETR